MALHTSTIISRRTADVLAHISQLRSMLSNQSLLYAISVSQHTNSSELSRLVSSVKALSNDSVGCLSAPVPSSSPSWQRAITVSLASFDQRHATLFRSTIPGREAAQVGRWHAMHQRDARPDTNDYSRNIDWESALLQTFQGSLLPPALQSLSANTVDSVVYLSDNAPEGLNDALSSFATATKLGLIATSTPFVTGRPYTMFHNDEIYSDGAVGVCLSSPVRSKSWSDFPGLEPLTRPMIVTSVEGNLINALDNANPSRLLLHAVQNHPSIASSADQNISKDLQLYLGTLKQEGNTRELDQLFYITSGDPSRGSLALDTDSAPPEGTMIQMFLLPPSAKPDVLRETRKKTGVPPSRSLTFAAASLDDLNALSAQASSLSKDDDESTGTVVIEDTFVAASENGMVVSRATEEASERPWKCVVPGSLMGMRWTV